MLVQGGGSAGFRLVSGLLYGLVSMMLYAGVNPFNGSFISYKIAPFVCACIWYRCECVLAEQQHVGLVRPYI